MKMATTKQNIQLGIRSMLLHFTDCKEKNVVCGFNNRVALPADNDFIIFTVMNPFRYGTPLEVTTNKGVTSYQTYRCIVQIDFYGNLAFDRACDIVNISRTELLCNFLKTYGIQPIACDDAKNLTNILGEKEYVDRWSVDLEIDYQKAVNDNQDWFNTAELNIFETEL